MKSVMMHNFSQSPAANIQRSQFNRSHGYKTTFDAGKLIPVYVDEALPGDTFTMKMSAFARLNTPIVPIMDNIYLDTFFFAVPYRLVWDNWEHFMGAKDNPDDTTEYSIPVIQIAAGQSIATHSIDDYMGIPTITAVGAAGIEYSALPRRAYNLIWNEWFRDENLQDSIVISTGDGPDSLSSGGTVQYRGKRHDYFTSCLPWPQKGDSVNILPDDLTVTRVSSAAAWKVMQASSNSAAGDSLTLKTSVGGGISYVKADTGGYNLSWDPNGGLEVTASSAGTINQLREAFQIQKLLERDARGGTRYIEIIRSHFGVISPDARLQRPEYLGGGTSYVNIHPVAQTSSTDATTPQGNLAAFGTGSVSGHGFTKSFTEHCIIIGLMCARADLTYQRGLNRMWSRQTKYDFYWPALANIGEQAVLKKEIYCDGETDDETVFGYQERYAEYRYKPSLITGQFRSEAASSLDIWHLSQEFTDAVALNSDFINEVPPIDRVVATPAEPHFMLDCYFDLKCARPMPVYSVPGLVDHF